MSPTNTTTTNLRWEAHSDIRFCSYNRKKHVAQRADGSSFVVRSAEFSRAWEVYYVSPWYTGTVIGQFATVREAKAAAVARAGE